MMPSNTHRLKPTDWAILWGFGLALFVVPILMNRTLSTHEGIHCQNVREMLQSGDWLIPSCGERPWLERPPLPHWLTAGPVWLTGATQSEWAYRISPALAGLGCVLLLAWMASRWFGRAIGLMSALSLATMREFTHYSLAPECDIFLCLVVTAAFACFAASIAGPAKDLRFFGGRSWPVLGFFVLLGLANLAKGLFFGTLMIAVPVGGYLLARADWAMIRRFVWLWGWLAAVTIGSMWALTAYSLHPGVVELWGSDYLGRLNQGYMREPWYYYFLHWPWVVFPWTILSASGLVWSARRAWQERESAERFVICWAVLALLFLCVPQGKHHHYMIHGLAPWAVLAAVGALRFWQVLQGCGLFPTAIVFAVLGDIGWFALWLIFPGKVPLLGVLLVGWPLFVGLLWWGMRHPKPWPAGVAVASVLVLGHWISQGYQTYIMDTYVDDRAFAARVTERIRSGERVYVLNDIHPLDSAWLLFYLPERTPHLHNLTFLHDERLGERVVIAAKELFQPYLASYGQVQIVDASRTSRFARPGPECWTLYEVQLYPDVWRGSIAGTYVTPMQATGRAEGPYILPMRSPQFSQAMR